MFCSCRRRFTIDIMPEHIYFEDKLSETIWDSKYRYRNGKIIHDQTITDSWKRIARSVASVELKNQEYWAQKFFKALQNFRFIPGGRILAGAGTTHQVTLFNCFVMGLIEDSIESIFDSLKEGALTMQQGGGVGYDFSTLRPSGFAAKTVGTIASGPVSFMRIWDSMCATLLSTGARRGAMMATLRCDHPDIETFIKIKQDKRELRHFNLSVLVSDAFMNAVDRDDDWPLIFPIKELSNYTENNIETIIRQWSGSNEPVACRVINRIPARDLWQKLMRATYDYAEPGVLFIDRINRLNNLSYRETISATNPCGEIPLPPYGACNLGSINLTQFIQNPFTCDAKLDMNGIEDIVKIAVRMLDNVIDLSHFPLESQAQQAKGSRRVGLGLTGLADTLIMLGITYGSDESYAIASAIMKCIAYAAYRASIQLAKEKGAFPFFDKDKYLTSEFIQTLPDKIQHDIHENGIRNSHLTTIAPTGTISLLANNVSSGLEPIFDYQYSRRMLGLNGQYNKYQLTDYAYKQWQHINPKQAKLPPQFIHAQELLPESHLDMQAAVQPFVDNAISKTINVPESYSYTDFKKIYRLAYKKGLKGCTTFRLNPVTGAILEGKAGFASSSLCCDIEREAD